MGEPMRALSIQQPWLGAIVLGDKRVENRTWPAPSWWITGQVIALHASKRFDWDAEFPGGKSAMWHPPEDLPLGAVAAVAQLTGCHDATYAEGCSCSPWAASRSWHWELSSVRLLAEPVPCRGMLGLWRLPGDVEKAVRAQLEEAGDGQ